MLKFQVVCFKEDIGIFTAYSARIKSNSPTPLGPPVPPPPRPLYPPYPPIPRDPNCCDKVNYDVVVYTNPELTQSIVIYSDKNINICRLVLNNFIKMCLNGHNIIDLNRINDKCPIILCENYNDNFNSCPPYFNPWDKNFYDPRKKPYHDCFDTRDHHCDCKHDKHPEGIVDFDCSKIPPRDGEVVSCDCKHDNFKPLPPDYECCRPGPHPRPPFPPTPKPLPPCPPGPPVPPPYPPCPPPCPPGPPVPPPYPPCPPPCPPRKIEFFYGNGGFAMGESVKDSIVEIRENALRTMLEKNHKSTYSNMNPRDTIEVKRGIRDTILPDDSFEINMDIAGEWCFFMIPDKFYKLIKKFNWYYQDETTGNKWIEAPLSASEQTFTIQDNGIRYYINAIRLNGDYRVRFTKSALLIDGPDDSSKPDDPRELDSLEKFRITIHAKGISKSNKKIIVKSLTDKTITDKTCSFDAMEEDVMDCITTNGNVYEINSYENETYTPIKYFKVIKNYNYKKGFSIWTCDTKDGVYTDSTGDVILLTIE